MKLHKIEQENELYFDELIEKMPCKMNFNLVL